MLSCWLQVAAQIPAKVPSQKEITMMLADAKKKMGAAYGMTLAQNNGKPIYFPTMNHAALQGLPKKILNEAELRSFVAKVMDKIRAKMDTADYKGALKSIDELKEDTNRLALMSVFLFESGAYLPAMYISAQVVLMDIRNGLNINNLGAMLNLSGKEELAIPILKSILKGNEQDPLLLNNIGQAFAGLGQRDSALFYFNKCLKEEPMHAYARTTAARIEAVKGNKAKAAELLEQVPDAEMPDDMEDLQNSVAPKNQQLYTPFKKVPDYFNLYKFKYPEFQTNVYDYIKAYTAQEELRDRINAEIERLQEIVNQEQSLGRHDASNRTTQVGPITAKAIRMMTKGYTTPGAIMTMSAAKLNYDQTKLDMRKRYEAVILELDRIYSARIDTVTKKVGEGGGAYRQRIEELRKEACDKKNDKANEFLLEFAEVSERYTQKQLNYAAQIFHFQAKWHRLAGINEHIATVNYYQAAIRYLESVKMVADYIVIPPFCVDYDRDMNKTFDYEAIFESSCQLNLNLSFGAGSYKLNCKSATFTWDSGIRFKFNKKFTTKESSIQLGYGWKWEKALGEVTGSKGGGTVGAKIGVKADAAILGFIEFDGKGGVKDVGIKGVGTASLSAAVGYKEMRIIPKNLVPANLKEFDLNPTSISIGGEIGVESSAGINSGFTGRGLGLLSGLF